MRQDARLDIGFVEHLRRQCGSCTTCCKLVPVQELNKPEGQRCKHQRAFKGCAVYRQPKKGFPASCALWSCRWLVEDDTQDLARPDRSHLVIDIMPDFISLEPKDGSPSQHVEVIQVWIDPSHPEAIDDPAFRRYLERRADEGKAAIIRFDAHKSVVVFAPAISENKQWNFVESKQAQSEKGHTVEQIMTALSGTRHE